MLRQTKRYIRICSERSENRNLKKLWSLLEADQTAFTVLCVCSVLLFTPFSFYVYFTRTAAVEYNAERYGRAGPLAPGDFLFFLLIRILVFWRACTH
jgi:hypothetical protein